MATLRSEPYFLSIVNFKVNLLKDRLYNDHNYVGLLIIKTYFTFRHGLTDLKQQKTRQREIMVALDLKAMNSFM